MSELPKESFIDLIVKAGKMHLMRKDDKEALREVGLSTTINNQSLLRHIKVWPETLGFLQALDLAWQVENEQTG
jgi:hypothetical protein